MRRLLVFLAAVALLLVAASPATANNDPHRFPWLEPPSGDFPPSPIGPCPFAIHGVTLVGNQYASDVVLPDGSEVIKITGSYKARLSANGKSIDLNVSGPLTAIIHPDGTSSFKAEGRQLIAHPALPDLGFPSRYLVFSGRFEGTQDASGLFTSVSHLPHVDLDICAALS